jgi:hypothetical protein
MEVNGQLNAPTASFPGESAPGSHLIGGWMGSKFGLEILEKTKMFNS